MSLEENVNLQCPYCWEMIDILVDCSVEEQQYTEDCSVCCRPIVFNVTVDVQQTPVVSARREDEA